MKIIFVGLHNKPNMQPLDSHTKTGKLLDRIIKELPRGIEIIKSNLFDVDYMPCSVDFIKLIYEWYWEYLPIENDIIVLLGAIVHKEFIFDNGNIVKIAHPASKRSHGAMDNYVVDSVKKLKCKLII